MVDSMVRPRAPRSPHSRDLRMVYSRVCLRVMMKVMTRVLTKVIMLVEDLLVSL